MVAAVADDDVVEHVDTEECAGVDQSPRSWMSSPLGVGITGWMIVRLMCSESLCGRISASAPSVRRTSMKSDT